MDRHRCEVPGCNKAFSRPSHLQRHALNHYNAQWVCERCNACFKRLDLLERHTSRHSLKDRRAGGDGLGVLETKKKHFRTAETSKSAVTVHGSTHSDRDRCPPASLSVPIAPLDQRQVQPLPSAPGLPDGGPEGENYETMDMSEMSEQSQLSWQSGIAMHSEESSRSRFAQSSLNYGEAPTYPSLYRPPGQSPGQSPGLHEMGNMYHDMTFDVVHFNVMGYSPQSQDLFPLESVLEATSFSTNQGSNDTSLPASGSRAGQAASMLPLSKFGHGHASVNNPDATQSTADASNITDYTSQPEAGAVRGYVEAHLNTSTTTPIRGHITQPTISRLNLPRRPNTNPQTRPAKQPSSNLVISLQKREELFEFIAEIKPVRPNGFLIDENAEELGLETLQTYLNLYFAYFNTTYPIIHTATLDVDDVDPIILLSMILLGATYKDKDAHQLSVCLYDAIIPYILSDLLATPVPDLTILQSFLILECYGMYRAGPYQRENAILIHALLWNCIRRITRYHVRARIMLPDRLTHQERDWQGFAYAEQYKRLILFFFMWDTQNVTCYSFMPNMSIRPIQIGMPCSKKIWNAQSETEWKELVKNHDETHTCRSLVEKFVSSSDEVMLTESHDLLSFTMVLHGIMSICNDMLHFDNRSIYVGALEEGDVSWSPWHQQMGRALESWKARYDAFAMSVIWEMESESFHSSFQRDSVSLFALYNIAHIVINCEVRHLQIAAGAKAIFGHIVAPSDYEESCEWVRNWMKDCRASAGRAAWHAAQIFREGMLNLKNWDVHGAFHYPWCLYIGALTCWAYHHFGREAMSLPPVCKDPKLVQAREQDNSGRDRMSHLVATMASVTPASMDRVMGKCCTHGLTFEIAKYLRSVRWTAAFEAMKILEGLSVCGHISGTGSVGATSINQADFSGSSI